MAEKTTVNGPAISNVDMTGLFFPIAAAVAVIVAIGFVTYLGTLMALRDFFGASEWDEVTRE